MLPLSPHGDGPRMPIGLTPSTPFWQALTVQSRVVRALILREMQTSYGRANIGYLWALIEPLILLGLFLLAFTYRDKGDHGGMNLVSFLATGIITFIALRSTAKDVSRAPEANKGLLLYPQVTPLDTMIARGILQSATHISVFAIIILAAWSFNQASLPHDMLGTLVALLALALLGFSIGMMQNALLNISSLFKHIMSPMWRFLFFTSCVFYSMKDLPEMLQNIMYYNPIAHAIELLRKAFFIGFESPVHDYHYIMTWIIICLFFGLLSERLHRYGGAFE